MTDNTPKDTFIGPEVLASMMGIDSVKDVAGMIRAWRLHCIGHGILGRPVYGVPVTVDDFPVIKMQNSDSIKTIEIRRSIAEQIIKNRQELKRRDGWMRFTEAADAMGIQQHRVQLWFTQIKNQLDGPAIQLHIDMEKPKLGVHVKIPKKQTHLFAENITTRHLELHPDAVKAIAEAIGAECNLPKREGVEHERKPVISSGHTASIKPKNNTPLKHKVESGDRTNRF